MSEQSPDEPSIATARAARTAELAGAVLIRSPSLDAPSIMSACGRALAKAAPVESQHAPPPPEFHEKSPVVAKEHGAAPSRP